MEPEQTSQSVLVQRHLDALRSDNENVRAQARNDLIAVANQKLLRLASKMLSGYDRLRSYEESADILQNATMRLFNALKTVTPPAPIDFYRLGALQIRRELIDLSRHYYGPQGPGKNEDSMPAPTESRPEPLAVGDSTYAPDKLSTWAELHTFVDRLPPADRDLFDLLWYQELTQPEAAELLGIPLRSLKRQWQAVRRQLADHLGDQVEL